jgi:hypothetical protein
MPSLPAPETTPAAAPGGGTGPQPAVTTRAPAWPPRGPWVAIMIGYLLLAFWIMWPFWRDPAHLYPATNVTDPEFFDWALVHATRIFTHGENPFFTPTLNAPLGVSMIANTGMLLLAIPLVPVTLVYGPATSLALIITLGLAATAAAWYHVLSRYIVESRAAALGGMFCGFAPGMVNHANAHPNIVAQFLIPLIVVQALRLGQPDLGRRPGRGERPEPARGRGERSRPPWWRGVGLGLLVTAQAFLNEELLFLTALAMAVFVAGFAVFRRDEVRRAARPFLIGITIAAGTAGVLLAYPLWFQFSGPGHYHGLPEFVLGYGSDLASYPAFPKLSLVGGDGTLANQPEENSFLGWPLLLALPVVAGTAWRRPAARALSLVGIVFAALSLGRTVNYHNHPVLPHGPWDWLDKLPLFDSVVPTRLALVVIPAVGVLLAMSVDRVARAPRPMRYAVLAVLAAVLVPIAPRQLPVVPRPAVPHFFTSGDWRRFVGPGQAVLNADTSVWMGGIDAMRWCTATRQEFRVVGGYFLGPDSAGRGTYGPQYRPTSAMLFYVAGGDGVPEIGGQQRADLVDDVQYWDLAIIVLAPGTPHEQDLRATLDELIGPGARVDDVWLWDVRRGE